MHGPSQQKPTTPLDARISIVVTAARALIAATRGAEIALVVDGYDVVVAKRKE